ncbi:MAG: hypothetical protein K6V73_02320 [Firmicutes bacterium]|nr:hypothetical protein [Bacillota bacterium]
MRNRQDVGGRNLWRVTVVDLVRARRLDFVLPPGAAGAAVRAGRLY